MSLYLRNPHVPAMRIAAYPKRQRPAGPAVLPRPTASGLPDAAPVWGESLSYADFFRLAPDEVAPDARLSDEPVESRPESNERVA